MTPNQRLIFHSLVYREYKRLQIESCTQYGKSLTVALACIIITAVQGEVVSVIAPSKEKAKEIMRYYVDHLGDSPIFYGALERTTRLERLRQEENKERIILNNGGGIFVLSTNERSFGKSIESAMGKGSKIVIMDEACLIRDDTESTVFRMIAGKGANAFYCKIGNTFYTEPPYSHFFKSSARYARIFIDYKIAIAEGRYTEEFINEARGKPLFRELYDCKFPKRDEIDREGYRFLIQRELLEDAFIEELPENLYEKDKDGKDIPEEDRPNRICGADIGRGKDASAFVLKHGDYMWIDSTNHTRDTMTQVQEIERIDADQTNVDDVGVGGGVTDRAREKGLSVNPINWAGRPIDREKFANIKAENYWGIYEWIKAGGKIVKDPRFYELLEIKYKINTSEKILIEPKERLAKRGVASPNVADAGALCFNPTIEPDIAFV